MHGCGWVQVDVVGEGAEFESECHTLQYHLLVKVWRPKGGLNKTIEERKGCGLIWMAAGEVSSEHVEGGVKAVNGVWRQICEPFEGGAFKGGWKGFAVNDIVGSVEGNMCYVYFEVLVCIGFACITVQREGFPLGRERGVGDGIGKRVATSGWLGW